MNKLYINIRLILILVLACIGTNGHIAAQDTDQPDFEEVSFTTEDDVLLVGRLFGDDDGERNEIAIILAHQGDGATQDSWLRFARLLAERGFTVLTFDFRGVGQSEGRLMPVLLPYDVRAAVEFLRDRGYERLACMGASMGGTACLITALEVDFEGVGVIASLNTFTLGSVSITDDELGTLTMPKLFVCAENDWHNVPNVMTSMHEHAAEPKELVMFPDSSAHGTNLFHTEHADAFTDTLVNFLESLSAPAGDSPGKIVFASDQDGDLEIYVMNADGSDQQQLTDNASNETYPVWSPDGTRIAFASDQDGNWEIYVMNADGSNQQRLTQSPAHDENPDWLPE